MHEFAAWAPRAKQLAVVVAGKTYPMEGPDERGWWKTAVDHAGPGDDYGFTIDQEEKVYPNPRSLWQPHGVHGLSRVYDHAAFHWSDAEWKASLLSDAILYELHIGTFTRAGTFDAVIEHLPYLHDLGVTHIQLMPVAEFPGRFGWGYDGASLFAVYSVYGGPDGLKRLVDAAHSTGLAVLLDVVYNHFGPVGNYSAKFGPYITDRHHTPWGGAINFEDAGSNEVRRFFCDNALMWLRDYHIDGLRLDAVHEFIDRSAIHFMEQLSSEVHELSEALGRPLVLIAESDLNDPRVVTPREKMGYGMDAQWSDDFHHALFTVINPDQDGRAYYRDFGRMDDLAKSLEHAFVYDGQFSVYRQRSHGRPVQGLSAHRFLGFIQNHDQVGNRATGDRIERIVGMRRAKIAAALVLTSPFVAMIFQGEEYAASTPYQYFADHEDPEMARAVSEGRRREFAAFGWDPAAIPDPENFETFARCKLNWDEVNQGHHAEMLEWYRKLICLRANSLALRDGSFAAVSVRFDAEKMWLRMKRGPIDVVTNLGDHTLEVDDVVGMRLLLASRYDIALAGGVLRVPTDGVAILSAE